ncbi:hypothetical protein D3C75_1313350 [compost metagenome]
MSQHAHLLHRFKTAKKGLVVSDDLRRRLEGLIEVSIKLIECLSYTVFVAVGVIVLAV